MHLTESYNFLSIYTIYIRVVEKCRKHIYTEKNARQKENNKAVYESKNISSTRRIQKELISRHDKYIREKMWISDVDGTVKDRGKSLQVNVREMSNERISKQPHQQRQTTLQQPKKIV